MATDLSPHEASTGNGNDVRADLWLFQLRREHATLYEMFTQRDNDIKKLLSENQEHRTTIRNLMNEARRREKLRLESIEQLEGLQSQFVQHQDTLSAFEREIETLRKTPGSAHRQYTSCCLLLYHELNVHYSSIFCIGTNHSSSAIS